MKRLAQLTFTALALISYSASGYAEDSSLKKNWRDELSDRGIEFEAVLTSDTFGNISGGGLKRGARELNNIDLTAAIDTAKAGWWQNGRAFLYLLGDFGGHPSEIVGDAQVLSNIDAPTSFKVYEAWYEHSMLDGALSILGGLHDYNSEFNSLEYAGNLLNSSFGVTPELAQIGPSIFPTTALAVRLKVQPTEQSYAQFALYDGVPGDPNNSRGTHIILKRSDGLFYAAELGLVAPEQSDGDYFKAAIGGWVHSTDFEDYRGVARSRNTGFYLIGEKSIFSEDDKEQGLGAFLQLGFANSSRNEFDRYFGGGFSYHGIIPERDSDTLSLGCASIRHADDFMRESDDALRSETSLELSYRAEISSWLTIQPDFQYIINPGAVKAVNDAKVIGVRIEIAL